MWGDGNGTYVFAHYGVRPWLPVLSLPTQIISGFLHLYLHTSGGTWRATGLVQPTVQGLEKACINKLIYVATRNLLVVGQVSNVFFFTCFWFLYITYFSMDVEAIIGYVEAFKMRFRIKGEVFLRRWKASFYFTLLV